MFVSHDPAIAAQVANAYADLYVRDILVANSDSVGQTTAWMQTRLEELQQQAQAAANAAERFAAENSLVEFSSGGLLTEQALNELNSNLTAVLTEAARAQAVLDTYERAVEGGVEGLTNNNSALAIGGDVSLELRARLDSYNDVQARLQRLLTTSGPDHPQVAGLQQTLATTAERLFVELQARRAEAQSALDVANARVEALQQSVQQASERNSDQAANFVRLRALQEEAATLSTIYQQTLTRSQEIEQQQSFPVSNVRILSYAQVPTSPSGPAVLRTALAATLLGLFLGMAVAALLWGYLNQLSNGGPALSRPPAGAAAGASSAGGGRVTERRSQPGHPSRPSRRDVARGGQGQAPGDRRARTRAALS